MPPQKPPRMTANPVKPSRYRPGKPLADAPSSSSSEGQDDDAASDASDNDAPANTQPSKLPPPKATSFPTDASKKVTSNLRNVDLNQRRRQDEARERAQKAREYRERQQQEKEAGFVTESESGDESSHDDAADTPTGQHAQRARPPPAQHRPPARSQGAADDASSSEEEDSDDDASDADTGSSDSSSAAAAPRKRAAPVFLRKDQRNNNNATAAPASATADQEAAQARAEADAARRAAETDAMVQERLERDAAARAAGKKSWDDDEPDAEGLVDDTDGLDPELEHAQWVARELGRLKRARAALEAREAEIAEVERRRGLSTPEREAEDRARVDAQREEKMGRSKAGFMQRYHHKGAFYNDEDAEARGLLQRDLMGATYEGDHTMKEALPQYLQVRDATMIGRKGRTRYRDLKTEDTGRWGDLGRDPRRGGGARAGDFGGSSSFVDDERFRPDGDARGPSGANASAVGERKRPFGDDHSRQDEAKRPRTEEEAR